MKMLTNDRNQCQGCKTYFNSTKAFDKHRRGEHGHNRRCLTEAEMLAKGMSVNKDGFWVTKAMPVSVRDKKRAGDVYAAA